jgi:hypothetical protein
MDGDVIPFDIAKLAEALSQRIEISGIRYRGNQFQYTDVINPAGLLGASRER